MMNAKEAAKYLNINEKKLYSLISESHLPATKMTGKWLFSKALIDQWVLAHTRNIPAPASAPAKDDKLLIITGSNDILLEKLIFQFNQQQSESICVFGNMGSMGGIQTLKKKACDIATSHLVQNDEQEYNFAFIDLEFIPPPVVVNFCRREQGVLLAPGNPHGIRQIADLGKKKLRIINRAVGTGTRLLFDRELKKVGLTGPMLQGYENIAVNHLDVGLEIVQGKVDAGIAIRPAATLLGLDFLPLRWERYDFLIDRERFFTKTVQQFLGMLNELEFRKIAAAIDGYDLQYSGKMVYMHGDENRDTPPEG